MPVEVNALLQAAINLIGFALAVLAASGIVGKVVVWAKGKLLELEASQPENIQKWIEWAVTMAADFAEKLDLSGQLEQYARSKKELAVEYAHTLLVQLGFDVSLETIDAALEALLFNNPDKYPSGDGNSQG